jgi:cation:H+ antiporter
MILPIVAVAGGLVMLAWSADRFFEGSAAVARYAGMPLLLIGMIIVGFGTSAPEMVVSAIAAFREIQVLPWAMPMAPILPISL